MASNFIPSFHLIPSEQKMSPEWCKTAVDYYWHHSNVKSLLYNKDIDKIERFASGEIDMKLFMSMYKSIKKKFLAKATQRQHDFINRDPDIDDIIFQPLPLIQSKLKSAISLIQKIPLEVTCTANDALAMKKKKEDIEFLKNKPYMEEDLQDIADQLQLDKVDLGTTKHSDTKYSAVPFGLDLEDPQQEKVFSDMIYALSVETAFETALQHFTELKNIKQVRLLETADQYKFGVSVNQVIKSGLTSLPDIKYIYPDDVLSADSMLPDYSDREAVFVRNRLTINELFNRFGNEIGGTQDLEIIINDYCESNKQSIINKGNYNTAKVSLVYCEISSIDYVGVYSNPKSKRGFATITEDSKAVDKIWGQNTYTFYWLENTKYFFAIDKLGYAYRTKGKECYQSKSINIYKSTNKSAVELSIGENIKAQVADIKLNFAIVMAKADGVYIDLKGIRNAATTLKEKDPQIVNKLIESAIERNIVIADTEGFEGKNDGQFKPVIPIPGGIGNVAGYLSIIQAADQRIDQFIGTNASLTGMSANPDALIGVEKLRINASINALYYITDAVESQLKKMFHALGYAIQSSIESGGKVKKALLEVIGADSVDILDGLNETPLHDLTIKIGLGQREEERANYQAKLMYLIQKGAITLTQEYMLSSITNPKKRFSMLAMIEENWKKEQNAIRQQSFEQQQAIQQQVIQGNLQQIATKGETDVQKIYAEGEVDAKIAQLISQLGLQKDQFNFLVKRSLQRERGEDQRRKAIDTQAAKIEAKIQQPLPVS